MQFLIVTEYILGLLALTYIAGIISVWACEFRKTILYRQMQQQIRSIENLHLSAAMLHVKTYKINRDYHQKIEEIECVQSFILKKMLLMKKSSLKNMPMRQNGQAMGISIG